MSALTYKERLQKLFAADLIFVIKNVLTLPEKLHQLTGFAMFFPKMSEQAIIPVFRQREHICFLYTANYKIEDWLFPAD